MVPHHYSTAISDSVTPTYLFVSLLKAFQKNQKTNPVIMSGYGATEMASSMVMYRPGVLDDVEKQKMTVGRARKPIQVRYPRTSYFLSYSESASK